jgi:hypothetical protein
MCNYRGYYGIFYIFSSKDTTLDLWGYFYAIDTQQFFEALGTRALDSASGDGRVGLYNLYRLSLDGY